MPTTLHDSIVMSLSIFKNQKYTSVLDTISLFYTSFQLEQCTGMLHCLEVQFLFLYIRPCINLATKWLFHWVNCNFALPFPSFLSSWYRTQSFTLHWNNSLWEPFGVTNGVKDSVTHIFTVHLHQLHHLVELGVTLLIIILALFERQIILYTSCSSLMQCMYYAFSLQFARLHESQLTFFLV